MIFAMEAAEDVVVESGARSEVIVTSRKEAEGIEEKKVAKKPKSGNTAPCAMLLDQQPGRVISNAEASFYDIGRALPPP